MNFLLLVIPLLAFALSAVAAGSARAAPDEDYYSRLYRLVR